MVKKRSRNRAKPSHLKMPTPRVQPEAGSLLVLDTFSAQDINKWENTKNKLLKYHWDYYSELAFQRSRIADQIRDALLGSAKQTFNFENYRRVVRYKWSLKPLDPSGSLKDPGQRFNIGEIDSTKFAPFSALYLAEDTETALQEVLCQDSSDIPDGVERTDFALAASNSITWVTVKGSIETYLDLSTEASLKQFVALIRDFKLPPKLNAMAIELGFDEPGVVITANQLLKSLLVPDWRINPMQFDVPANSQILGQLVMGAGIQAILFPSKMTSKNCLSIFLQNFKNSSSFLELADEAPADAGVVCRVDAKNWDTFSSC